MARLVTHRKRRDPFVRIEREVMEDPALSFKAKALYGWLLDKGDFPGGWDTDVERIGAITADGAFAIRGALEELQKARRLVRTDSGLGGRGKRAEWHIYDEPKPTENREVSEELVAETASDERGNRDVTPHNRETSSSETNDGAFVAFWFAYPHKLDKPAARRAWRKALKKSDAETIMSGLAAWAAVWSARGELKYIPYPATWLNGERWNDTPAAPTGLSTGLHPDVVAALAQHEGAS